MDEVTKKHGRKTGLAASLEFRTMIAWHTDTMAIGPVTTADLVAAAGKQAHLPLPDVSGRPGPCGRPDSRVIPSDSEGS